jgi:transposase
LIPPQPSIDGVDETGFRIAGQTHWLHTASTPTLTYYTVHRQRGDEAMLDAGVLPNSRGWAVHDGFKPYFGFETVRHALCNAHHLRELQFLVEHYQASWAEAMQQRLLTMKRHSAENPAGVDSRLIHELEGQYDALLAQGFAAFPLQPRPPDRQQPIAQHPATNLLIRLHNYRQMVLAFLHHPEVPFDNNRAERDLRMMKVKQKISGGFRTWAGAELFAALRTYFSTARKQAVSMLRAAQLAFLGSPFIPALPE